MSSPEPIYTTPPTSSPIPTMTSSANAKRIKRRRVFRPDDGSLYDLLYEHAGLSLFVRPICWTDLHVRLLDATFIELPPCDTPVPPPSPRGAPVSPSRCHMKPSAAATTLSRELTAMLAPGSTRSFYTNSIRTIMSTLYPSKLSQSRTQLDMHLYFGGLVYRDTCRVQVAWDAMPSRSGSIASFESASTRPAESFNVVPAGTVASATNGSIQPPTYTQPVLAYLGKLQIAATRKNMYRVIQGPNRAYNGPVERLQQLRSKLFVPTNPNHDPLLVGIMLGMAQRRFYGEPQPSANKWVPSRPLPTGLGEPRFHDVTVQLLTNDNETSEFIVYRGVVTAELLRKFHEPTKNPCDRKKLADRLKDMTGEGGMRIEYTRVPVWPILGLKERLGKALGKEVVGYFDEDNIETWEEEAERNPDRLKRRRDREALAEVFNGSFEEEAPDGMPLSGKRRCLVDEESGQVGVVV
ncbi:hypothetical protein LZ30DRAFT_603740 [Colletotrichum cereale]|nr:hypothetical protein LZ30DRAFT_603740 [Colletotrichum cereale]